ARRPRRAPPRPRAEPPRLRSADDRLRRHGPRVGPRAAPHRPEGAGATGARAARTGGVLRATAPAAREDPAQLRAAEPAHDRRQRADRRGYLARVRRPGPLTPMQGAGPTPLAPGDGAGDRSAADPLVEHGSITPYPGLRPFRREESDIFFGREELADELLRRLGRSRFLGVVGVSGCGKSSLLRAGMIPALESGFLPEAGVQWGIVKMRPGNRPIRRLAESLHKRVAAGYDRDGHGVAFIEDSLRRGPLGLVEVLREHEFPHGHSMLVLVDQFEEIFRYRAEGARDEAEAFVALLLGSAAQRAYKVFVVL